jgi:signal transduction histidine kinase
MNQVHNQAETAVAQQSRKPFRTGLTSLRGGSFVLVRAGWIAVVLLVLGLVIASIPTYAAYLHLPRVSPALAPADPGGQLTQGGMQELQAWGLSLNAYIAYLIIGNLLLIVSCLGTGTLIVWRTWGKTTDWMALCASYVLVTFPVNIISLMLFTLPPSWRVPINILSFLGEMCIALFGCLFPTGRFVPRWTGFLALGSVIIWGIYIFVPAASEPSSILAAIIFVLILLSLGCTVGVQVYRYRRVSNPVQRQQTKWVFFGGGISAGGTIVWIGLSALLFFQGMFAHVLVRSLFNVSQLFLLFLIPLSIGFAILRYRLWDIDIIINRTLVYGGLTVSITGLYVLVVVSLGTLLRVQGNLLLPLLVTGLIAVLFQPLRERLQRAINHLMYGERDTPYTVISRLGQRLEVTLAPEAILSAIVETVAQALKLPYAAIALKQDEEFAIAASYVAQKGGTSMGDAVLDGQDTFLHLPLLYQSEPVGELVLAPRARGESLTPADQRLLADLARQVGVAAHAVRLTADLQQSRERLVTAREEERRRLRRDLHDGLGPALASMTLKLDAARNLLVRDPSAADALLVNLKKQTQTSLADIRRLVYALRPPTLDELGLIQALREQAEQYHIDGLHMTIEAPEPLPPLPAAVEVAAYRIVQEAMTNVARHAQAHTCTIRFALDHGLDLEICDDGRGILAGQRAGVGLTSIRERAAELAGRCEIEAISAGGTRLHIRLPLPRATEREE